MMHGRVTKLVQSHGSQWGRVRADDVRSEAGVRDTFFNCDSMVHPEDFANMQEGQDVEFAEEPDRANGVHAVRLTICTHLPYTDFSSRFGR